jgi:NDP-sugar pyrophosphorylase family protein
LLLVKELINMTAIVLVGGSDKTPFTPTCGEPFLYWLLQWLKTQDFKQIVFSAAHHSEQIKTWVNDATNQEPKLCLDVVVEATPLGTGGAVALSANRHPANFTLVTNGDSLLLADLRVALKHLKRNKDIDGILFASSLPNAGRFGALELDKNHKLLNFKEKEASKAPINAGVYLLRSKLFNDIPTDINISLERECFPKWLAEGKNFEVIVSKAPFLDLGSLDGQKQAECFIADHQDTIRGQKEIIPS